MIACSGERTTVVRARRALGCEQERRRLLADARRLPVEVQPLDELPAALDADARMLARVAADLGHVTGGRVGVDPAAGLVDLLLDVRPLGRDEHLVLALGAHHRDGDLDVGVLHPLLRAQAEIDLVREGTENGSRSSGVRYSPVCASTGASAVRCRPDAARAKAVARRAVSRAAESSSRPIPENPQAPSTSTRTPTPSLSAVAQIVELAVLRDHGLAPERDGARVRVGCSRAERCIHRCLGQRLHRARHYPRLHCALARWWRNW